LLNEASSTSLSATAMSFLNVPLFFLAPEMVSDFFDAGQGIGVIQAMLSIPLWFGPYRIFLIPTLALAFLSLRRSHPYRSWV
jgi:hypothetical protein